MQKIAKTTQEPKSNGLRGVLLAKMLNEWIPCKNRVDARNKTKTQKYDATVMHLHATVNKHPFHMFQPATAEENCSKCITNDEVEEEEEEQE